MAYFAQNEPQQTYQPNFSAVEETDTVPETGYPYAGMNGQNYPDPTTDPYMDPDYDLYTEEDEETERLQNRKHWQVTAGIANFFSIIIGVGVILLLTAVIVSLITWLQGDMDQSLVLLLKNF